MNLLSLMRRNAGYKTQESVGIILGVDGVTVSRWESGTRNPSIENIQRLAKLYNVTADEIISALVSAENSA